MYQEGICGQIVTKID